MVQKEYVIAHIEGQPVYAKEMVPASGAGEDPASDTSDASDEAKDLGPVSALVQHAAPLEGRYTHTNVFVSVRRRACKSTCVFRRGVFVVVV
jgi:hypothetical protein